MTCRASVGVRARNANLITVFASGALDAIVLRLGFGVGRIVALGADRDL